jgi:hypothetical protein
VFHFDCPECMLRREDAECRALSERLFTVAAPELLPE